MEKTTNERLPAYSPEARSTGKAEEVQVVLSDKKREIGKGSMVQDLEKQDKKPTFHKKGGLQIQGWEGDLFGGIYNVFLGGQAQ